MFFYCLFRGTTLTFFWFSPCRKPVRHTWLDCLRTPTCALSTQRGWPSCPRTFSWPGESEGSVHKWCIGFYLFSGGVGGVGTGVCFVNLELLPACVPPNLSFVVLGMFFCTSFVISLLTFSNCPVHCRIELHICKCWKTKYSTASLRFAKLF